MKEAVGHLSKDYGFTRLISIFMKRRIQPLQARPSTMWEYSGPEDASRMGRKDLAEKALDEAMHGVIKGAKNEELPSDCPVNPYGGGRELPEVCSSTSIYLLFLIFFCSDFFDLISSCCFPGSSEVLSVFLLLLKTPIFQRILMIFLRLALVMIKVLMKNLWKMKMLNLHRRARGTEREGPKKPWTSTLKTLPKEMGIRLLQLLLLQGLLMPILPRLRVAH